MREEKSIHEAECVCKSNYGLFIPNRKVSGIIAGMLTFFFVTFVAGFFLGRQQKVAEFTRHLEQLSLAYHPNIDELTLQSALDLFLTLVEPTEF